MKIQLAEYCVWYNVLGKKHNISELLAWASEVMPHG